MNTGKPDFILFGEGNYNTLGVLHQLGELGIDPVLLIIGKAKDRGNGYIIGYSKFARRIVEVSSAEKGLEWLSDNRGQFANGTIIYPTADTTEMLLDGNLDNLSATYVFPNAGRQGEVTRLMDKELQTELARRAGLRIITSQFTTSPEFLFDKVTYPCMAKPLNSTNGSKGDMKICDNEKELRHALASGKQTRDFIVQQYIRNEADLLFLGVAFANGDIWLPAVVVKPGVSPIGEYTHAVISTDVEKYLPEIETVRAFVRSTNYQGPFSIEFGLERGKNYFFEINLRNDGTSHYPLAAGVNIAGAYIDGSMPGPVPTCVYEMIDEVGDLRRVLNREISFGKWLKTFRNAGSYRFYNKGDRRLIPSLTLMFLNRTFGKFLRILKKH